MYEILKTLVKMISPILTFTSEEVWKYMQKETGMPDSVQLASWPKAQTEYLNAELEQKWSNVLAMRGELTKALEIARRNKVIGHPLDAKLNIYADGVTYSELMNIKEALPSILIVSQVNVIEGTDKALGESVYKNPEKEIAVEVTLAEGDKCERCWIYDDSVGADTEHPTLCKRCAEVVKQL